MPRNPQVNFYLKPKDNEGKCLIYLQFKYNGNRLFYSFGQRIKPNNWSTTKQRVKNVNETTNEGNYNLNQLLNSLSDACEAAYNIERTKGLIPHTKTLALALDAVVKQNPTGSKNDSITLHDLIERFVNGEIKHRGKRKSTGTLKSYKTTFKHLKEFEKQKKYRIDFDTITLDFYYKFVDYLENKGLAPNSIGNAIKNIKTFMAEAVDFEYTTNMIYLHKKFAKPAEQTDSVYLSDAEILRLYRVDLSHNKRLEQVKDLFVFGCYVGLRFSDYSDIKKENIIIEDGEHFIKVITKKTDDLAIIPCNPVVLEIFDKYKESANSLPRSLSNQKFNQYIKEVCKAVGLTECGRLSTHITKPLNECVSSHTARRSFATNLYLQGYPTIEIMKITGHKTESAFLKYIKVDKITAAKRLSAHMKKYWGEKVLRIAS